MARSALVTAAVVVGVAAAAVGLLWAFQRSLVYFPGRDDVPPAASVLPGAQDVVLETSDGLELEAWLVPADAPDTGVTVLLAHGNGGDRAGRAPLARALAAQGISVLLLEYRGYAGNPGSPSEEGLALDARAGYRYLTEEAGVPPDRLVYFGESLGSAVVAELATEHPPAGLVLRSPFSSLAAMAKAHYPLVPAWLLRDEMDVAAHVARVDAPAVVVLGTADTIVPPAQSREVARSAAQLHGEVVVDGADHNDPVLLDGPQVVGAVVELVELVQAQR